MLLSSLVSEYLPKCVLGSPHMPIGNWTPPPFINIDGAYINETRQGAWGFIIRDHYGCPILVGSGNAGQVHNAMMAEAWLPRRLWNRPMNMARVQLEMDSSLLKEAICTKNPL